ncbi:hypothetical protein CS022_03530 [Veronia nyctiphanis]|uniref:Phytanoyl-CoA dioxygenase n=1 Tax=Veronia nyctiphanis TaxID=1278244 RepID=A0A4Q0YUY1_9GAMM|nr:phytanoyl-CoA dioxygenase family protein [Veronia nyctiphanis]RXJ74643.1 hypothetical protein CS022_03530 [Veronia nyctiphanis]
MTFFTHSSISEALSQLDKLCRQEASQHAYPHAKFIDKNVVIYDASALFGISEYRALKAEFANVLNHGPGVLVVKNAWNNLHGLDAMTDVFEQILEDESRLNHGDHFGQKDAVPNGRIWNVFQKSAIKAPDIFIEYYSNPILNWVSEAWLGPGYQVTAQVNVVYPGGEAQQPHRDYHMGFQEKTRLHDYPQHVHRMTPMLTLQGAVAHTDMPIEAGPTMLLPFSHQLDNGYISFHQPEMRDYFLNHAVQIPLERGDAIFFNPALCHAAGKIKLKLSTAAVICCKYRQHTPSRWRQLILFKFVKVYTRYYRGNGMLSTLITLRNRRLFRQSQTVTRFRQTLIAIRR